MAEGNDSDVGDFESPAQNRRLPPDPLDRVWLHPCEAVVAPIGTRQGPRLVLATLSGLIGAGLAVAGLSLAGLIETSDRRVPVLAEGASLPGSQQPSAVSEQHAWLGLWHSPDPDANWDSDGMPEGLYVYEVAPNGPASNSGIRAHDVIVEVDGDAIEYGNELLVAVRHMAPGDEIDLTVWHRGRTRHFSVVLEPLPDVAETGSDFEQAAPDDYSQP